MQEVVTYIREFCEGRDDCEFEESYSGRFMYGRQCVGFTVNGNFLEVFVELCDFIHDEVGVESLKYVFGRICMDGMGLGNIIYFPDLKPEEE